jgi:hypothetical protein
VKKILLTLVSLCCVLPWTVASAQGAGAESEIRDLNAREVKALLARDADTLKRLWSDDFVVTNPFNKFVKRRDVLDMTKSNKLAFSSYERQVEYVRLYHDNTMAVVAGSESVVWAGKMPTAGQMSRLRFTAVWLKQGGRWQQVARHANIVSPR